MSRLIATIVVLLVIVVGGTVLLAGRAKDQPTSRVETPVELGNLAS